MGLYSRLKSSLSFWVVLVIIILLILWISAVVRHKVDIFAGKGIGYQGDGGPARLSWLNNPFGLAFDHQGNVYIADAGNHVVRKIGPDGIIKTVAGTGQCGDSGDKHLATKARLTFPTGVATDAKGNLYIADSGSHRIRRIDTSGKITTIAGCGQAGYRGDGGWARKAHLNAPQDIALDTDGALYIADSGNHCIRRVTPRGRIQTIAGAGVAGFGGDGGPAKKAKLNWPCGLALDLAENLYIADAFNNRIRKVGKDGLITTIAGGGKQDEEATAKRVALRGVRGLTIDRAGNLYIVEPEARRIRRVDPQGRIHTVVRDPGLNGWQNLVRFIQADESLVDLSMKYLELRNGDTVDFEDVVVDQQGRLYLSDSWMSRVLRITP